MAGLFSSSKSQQKKKKQIINSFEVFRPEASKNTVDSIDIFKPKARENTTDSLSVLKPKEIGKAALSQVNPGENWMKDWLGFSESHTSGQSIDMQPGVAYAPNHAQEAKATEEKPEARKEAALDYGREILHVGESKKEEQESSQKIQMLIQELQRLAKSVEQIEKTLILQAIDPSAGKKTGKYYENFFEWMLLVVQDARRKVEDSGAWLATTKGKQTGGIHKLMKTNMQVGMSGERTQANNTA